MKNRHLRETVEIIGVISIVASLLLVAWEVRQANRKLNSPGNHLVTATEESQLQGLAWHFAGLYYSAQIAHDNGLLDPQRLDMYRLDLAKTLDRFPGLHASFLQIYSSFPEMRSMPVFQPLSDLEAQSAPQDADRVPAAD
jgi:hypothetical protein